MEATKNSAAIKGAFSRLKSYPRNNLSEKEMQAQIKKGNYSWSNGTESWPWPD